MNLPHVTARIGKSIAGNDLLTSLYANLKGKYREQDELYAVYLIFDLEKKSIYFDEVFPYTENTRKRNLFFGNNSAASAQYYLVREVSGLHYLLGSVLNDLKMELEKNDMKDCELANILVDLDSEKLIHTTGKKGKGTVNLDKFIFTYDNSKKDVKLFGDNKNIELDGNKINYEDFVKLAIGYEAKNKRLVMIIPKVVTKDGNEVVLSKLESFKNLVLLNNNLVMNNKDTGNKKSSLICYICGEEKDDVKCSEYLTKLRRDGINKIFTTTTLNSAKMFEKKKYSESYSVCSSCYRDLIAGEKFINDKLQTRIANERTFLIPEGIINDFDYANVEKIKEGIDLCFNPRDAQIFTENIKEEHHYLNDDNWYNLNFIIYTTDGNSVSVLQTIEDVSNIYFDKINDLLAEISDDMPFIQSMNLGSLYGMIPVRKNKSGEQLNVNRVLTFYKSILNKNPISSSTVFAYASEAYDKGVRQILKGNPTNYDNLGVRFYNENSLDFYFMRLSFKYIAVLQFLQNLNLLSKQIFTKIDGGGWNMEEKKFNNDFEAIKDFLETQGFTKEAKALFCLGTLIKKVATEQYKSKHKNKPILKKINFQGMGWKDVMRLYTDVVEKLRQYEKMTLDNENIMSLFHTNIGIMKAEDWKFDDHENVFYIMAGYSFMVGLMGTKEKSKDNNDSIEGGKDHD
ncbi:MAG: hypothetical protein KAX49_14530 [Halanaerobiales bacterium]|nr:hypothetical protein [Halanaerobiales bacterium]